MKQLTQLAEQNVLSPIDAEFGSLLGRKAGASLTLIGEAEIVAMTGAMLSAERGRGHSCLDLTTVAGRAPWPGTAIPGFPPLSELKSILTRSAVCNNGQTPSPLVLDGGNVYLYRFHAAECRLASAIRDRVERQAGTDPSPQVAALQQKLFPAGDGASTDWQAVAAAAALRNNLTVITGGPGTGKTTTVARILALLLAERPDARVALAAPTGKAAARLAQAIQAAASQMPIDDDLRARLPREGRTLHRLLGYQPRRDRFTYGPDESLTDDVVIVDEASMVDLLMMDALFAALKRDAKIILLGDPDQLVSVETGFVLGDICRAAADGGERASKLRDSVVRLQRSYRFERQPGIGALATAIGAGDAVAALDVLGSDTFPDVRHHASLRDFAQIIAPIAEQIDAYLAATDPLDALARLDAFRILSPVRDGSEGVAGLNSRMERWLQARGVHTRMTWYSHRPVLITTNDPATGLFNGDVGVAMALNGRSVVCVADGAGGYREIATARLPAHETAWAMTVHKSQGSEFDHVVLVLPDRDTAVSSRELLYTAVTRARKTVSSFGATDAFVGAIGRTTARASGLANRLLSNA